MTATKTETETENVQEPEAGAAPPKPKGPWVDPKTLTLVLDKSDENYDPRVEWPVDPALVASMKAIGWRADSHVLYRKGPGGALFVVAGRQRLKAALKAGLHWIKAVQTHGESADTYLLNLSENHLRRDDPPLVEAQKIAHALRLGADAKTVAAVVGMSVDSIKNRMKLIDQTTPQVKAALQAGKITTSDAVRLAGKPADKQNEALKTIPAPPAPDDGEPSKKKRRSKGKGSRKAGVRGDSKRPTTRAIERVLDYLGGVESKTEVALALGWVLGVVEQEVFFKKAKIRMGDE